ncbi:MAG: ATP-binding protein [Gammaproteobacteria bacterium]|nr:ATP-binding protein [Gammaproteobacteria bacterium]
MTDHPSTAIPLTDQAGLSTELRQQAKRAGDHAWIEVIQQMDSIYADLVHYQVELEQKNSELENAQRFIESVISSISDILIVCDINGHIQQVNQALVDIIGMDSEQLAGEPLNRIFSEKHLPMISEFPEHIRSGSLIDCEVDLVNNQQEPVPMAINCSARFDHKNRLSGLVITGRPLGELRRAYSELHKAHEELKTAQLQLIQSEKMASLGRLVAGVAHELNNPISFLFANMHALKSYQQKFQTYLDAIHGDISKQESQRLRKDLRIDAMMQDIVPLVDGSLEGAERVSEIVQNLRKFTTPQESKKQSFDLVSVVQRAVSWVLKAAQQPPELQVYYPESLTLVNNEGYVHQILINLIQNALDAMDDQATSQLSISIHPTRSFVQVIVRDHGPGILEQDLVKVFDPFFTTKPVGSGTGLGLYISYGLATEQCLGDLSVRNHPQGGAEFTLSLPLETG